MSSNQDIVVSVCMITFNHEAYIREAIEGVLIQKCNFPIELIIGEDCSTDKTRAICKEYALKHSEITLLPSETNLGMVPNFIRTIQSCTGKFIAFCEGDDYWTDPHKLQKQVDFLERNPGYGMVHTRFRWFFSEAQTEQISFRDVPSGDIYEDFLVKSNIGTLTAVAQKKFVNDYLDSCKQNIYIWVMGDRPLWLYIASRSKVKYLDEVTAVYRRHGKSVTSFSSVEEELKFFINSYQIRFFFMDNIRKPSEEIRNKVYENYNRGILEYNSRMYNRKASLNSFKYLKQMDLVHIKDLLMLLGSKGPIFRRLSSFLMFLFYGKKAFIKSLIKTFSF